MLAITIYLLFCMLAVLWFDTTRYLIPNWLVGSMLALYPIFVWQSPVAVDWKMGLEAMGIVFAIGYVVFAMKWMGGGDIKLLTACALWVGLRGLVEFMFLVAILGGAFSVLVWGARKVLSFNDLKARMASPRILQEGAPIPYGVAIAVGFLWLMCLGKVLPIG